MFFHWEEWEKKKENEMKFFLEKNNSKYNLNMAKKLMAAVIYLFFGSGFFFVQILLDQNLVKSFFLFHRENEKTNIEA